jgi:hypothetical protein
MNTRFALLASALVTVIFGLHRMPAEDEAERVLVHSVMSGEKVWNYYLEDRDLFRPENAWRLSALLNSTELTLLADKGKQHLRSSRRIVEELRLTRVRIKNLFSHGHTIGGGEAKPSRAPRVLVLNYGYLSGEDLIRPPDYRVVMLPDGTVAEEIVEPRTQKRD